MFSAAAPAECRGCQEAAGRGGAGKWLQTTANAKREAMYHKM